MPYDPTNHLTTDELAQLLADNVHRLIIWKRPSLESVASVSINGDSVQINAESNASYQQ